MIDKTSNDSSNVLALQKTSMFLLTSYPVLNAYILFGNITIAQAICCVLFLYSVFLNGGKTKLYPTFFLLFWGYAAVHLALFAGNFKITYLFPGGISLCLYAISLGVFCKNYNSFYFHKYLKWVFLFSAILFVFQYLIFKMTEIRISVFLPLSNEILYSISTYQDLVNTQVSFEDRFASIFLEPSYFGQYTLIVLAVDLFKTRNKKKIFTPFTLLIVFIELLIKSGVGLLGMIIVTLIKLVYITVVSKQKKYYFYLLLLLPVALYGVDYYLNSDMGSGVSDRASFETNINGEFTDQSANERLVYGFWEFDRLDITEKVMGTSMTNRVAIAERNTAINGFSNSLITYGWIGTILLLAFYIKACWRKSLIVVAFGILLLIISFVETILFDDFMLLCTVIILNECREQNFRYS